LVLIFMLENITFSVQSVKSIILTSIDYAAIMPQ
jgi:hypothetical protein